MHQHAPDAQLACNALLATLSWPVELGPSRLQHLIEALYCLTQGPVLQLSYFTGGEGKGRGLRAGRHVAACTAR